MAAGGRYQGRDVSLARGSLILIVLAVLSVGGVAGFGIGYKVEQNRTKSAVNAAKAKPQAKTKAAAKAAQLGLQKFRVCLAGQGLHWPVIPGKFATQMKTPPTGVPPATYKKALTTCYVAAVKARPAPPTTGAPASAG
jgi:hypothetical protein